jgi:AcrR family transcriptional regulator
MYTVHVRMSTDPPTRVDGMATRVRNQRGEGERLRSSLLDAARDLLADARSADELSVRSVTARAGVSPTALYLHFKDKDDLVREVKIRCFAALGETIVAANEAAGDDPHDRLRAGCHAYLRFAREQPGQYAILFHTASLPTKPRRRGGRHGVGMDVFELLVAGVAQVIGADDAFAVSTTLWAALHGRALLGAAMPDFPFPDEERFVALLVDEVSSRTS